MRYRVVRTVYIVSKHCSHGEEDGSIATIWEGDDPNTFTGGVGMYDEGCCHPCRSFQFQDESGTWVDCEDPRPRQLGAR